MARMKVTPISLDEGYPQSRCTDGMNVEECSSREGAWANFGSPRRFRREYVNSKTGSPMDKPDYANPADVNETPGRGY